MAEAKKRLLTYAGLKALEDELELFYKVFYLLPDKTPYKTIPVTRTAPVLSAAAV